MNGVIFKRRLHEISGVGCTGAQHGLPTGAELVGNGRNARPAASSSRTPVSATR